MSAMKMDFICKEPPPESDGTDAKTPAGQPLPGLASASASPMATTAPPSANKMSALLNNSDVDMGGDTSAAGTPTPALPPLSTVTKTAEDAPAGHTDALSDNEDSEDEQREHAAWQDVDLSPAVDLVARLVRESLEAGKTYNKSITSKTSQLLTGCDGVLLELQSLRQTRDASRKHSGKRGAHGAGAGCSCAVALGMLPLRNPTEALAAVNAGDATRASHVAPVDEVAEDQTDRALAKMEAAVGRLRELAELVQATSMQGEANLVSKVALPPDALSALSAAVQASAATATATAIAQERGRSSSAFGRLYLPIQVHKMQEWYYKYPRPLLDELTLMRTILNYRPYANPFQVGGLSLAHVRDWFKRRRHRERMRYVKLAVEAGHDVQAAEEEIAARLEQRIAQLRAVVDPNELVKEVDRVRAQSSLYEAAIGSFTRPSNLRGLVAASHAVPTAMEQPRGNSKGKRPRTQESELLDVRAVKSASHAEVKALQGRLRSLLAQQPTADTISALQQVVDLLRAVKVTPEVRIQTGLVADLKQLLRVYTSPSMLVRKSTVALLEDLGMNRRAGVEQDAEGDSPAVVPSSATSARSKAKARAKVKGERSRPPPMGTLEDASAAMEDNSPASTVSPLPMDETPEDDADDEPLSKKAKTAQRVAKSRGKEKGRTRRPMKFSMDQVTALEAWFQQKYKPSQEEMERYLSELNSPPLREPKQAADVSMTQLRRWFNKRRCLRRPPFALMTQQDAAKEGSKNALALEMASAHDEDEDDEDEEVDTNDDSSDDDDDDDSSDDDAAASRAIEQSMA